MLPLSLFQASTDKEITFTNPEESANCVSCNTYYETSWGEKKLGYKCENNCKNTAYIQLCIEYTYDKTYPKYVVLGAGKETKDYNHLFKRIYRFQYGFQRSDLDGNCDVN